MGAKVLKAKEWPFPGNGPVTPRALRMGGRVLHSTIVTTVTASLSDAALESLSFRRVSAASEEESVVLWSGGWRVTLPSNRMRRTVL